MKTMLWLCFRSALSFLFVLSSASCVNEQAEDSGVHSGNQTSPQKSSQNDYDEINARIAEILEQAKPCETIDDCDTVTVSLKTKSASLSSLGQRILVIDEGMELPAFTRYKSRVLDYLSVDEDGYYKSSEREIKIPRTIFTVLSEILDEQYPETPAQQLNPVAKLFSQHNRVQNRLIGHGDEIFATLADLNPQAEFVLADAQPVPADDLCAADLDTAAFQRYRKLLENESSSLRSIIEKHEINFVNMSFGDSDKTLRKMWARHCSEKKADDTFLNLLHKMYFESYYEPLFAMKNVVFVQAAPYSRRELYDLDAEFYSDCRNVPSRIRVAGFSSKESHLSIFGQDQSDLLGEAARGALGCTDLAINFGVSAKRPYEEGPFPVLTTVNGVGSDSISRPSSSTAAPIALSYINYLKQSGIVEGNGSEFVRNLKAYHQGKLVEPARYRQFEIHRLGRV